MDFKKFMNENRDKIIQHALTTNTYDINGRSVISKDDEWYDETIWDELLSNLEKGETK